MKAFYIVKREYVESAKKKSFIIGTIIAPLLLIVLYSIPVLSMFFVPDEQVRLTVLDDTGIVAGNFVRTMTDSLKDGRPKFLVSVVGPGEDYDARKEALIADISAGKLDILLEVPKEALETGRVNYISKDMFNERTMDRIRDRLNPIIVAARLAGEGLDYERVSKLTQRVRFNENKITKSGLLEEDQVFGEFILVVVFVMILYMSLLSWGLSVQRSVIEEKSSRVIEVMLSSVEPRDLFLGKIIGVGSLGLTQIAIWSAIILALAFSSSFATAQFLTFVNVSPMEVVYLMIFFVLGFLLFSSLFTIVGAVCNSEQDAQQLQTIVMLPLVVPIMLMFLVIQNPTATLSVTLSFIPFFSPMLMLTRIVISEPSVWEILLSVLILLLTIYGVIVFSARVFRVGILMYGKRPGLREIVKWSRFA